LTVLTDHNDWANVVYTGISDSDGVAGPPVLVACYAPHDLGNIEILDDEDWPPPTNPDSHSPPWQLVVGWALVLEWLSWRQ
jgi:hypothetical protein